MVFFKKNKQMWDALKVLDADDVDNQQAYPNIYNY